MKKILLVLLIGMNEIVNAQNAPFDLWGSGLDGSMFQKTTIYSDITYGLLIEAPLNANDLKLPIEFNWRGGGVPALKIDPIGNVGIGTLTPNEKLSVNGKIRAKEIKVEAVNWPDYVFEPTYLLPDLKATERFIKANKHLPEIPSAAEVEKDGISLGEMNLKLLKKIEELTLYLIEQSKQLEQKDKDLQALIERVTKLES